MCAYEQKHICMCVHINKQRLTQSDNIKNILKTKSRKESIQRTPAKVEGEEERNASYSAVMF